MGLSLFLISAVYTGVRLYWKYSSTGHDEVERALLARALLKRIEMDVRSVMYRAPVPASTNSTSSSSSSGSGSSGGGSSSSGSSSSGGSSGSGSGSSGGGGSGSSGQSGSSGSGSSNSSSSQQTQTTSEPEDLYNTSNTGLFGNSTTLLMHCSKPGRERVATSRPANAPVNLHTSDVATVSYFVVGTSTGILQHVASGQGLARLEGDRLALAMADQQSSIGLMAAQTQILAPEVQAIQFRYYDGLNALWRTTWDSSIMGGLPKALEVTMHLRPIPGHVTGSANSNTYRLVIAVPLGKPIDTTQIQ